MDELVPFAFEGFDVRVVDRNGDPWFVTADVCAALEISNSRDAVGKLDPDEKGVALTDTLGGEQQTSIINQSGLFTLILRCRDATKPGTLPHRFRKWVTSEVLPSIRKTGQYGSAPIDWSKMLNDPAALRGIVLTYTEKVLTLEAEKAELVPKAEALDRIATADGSLCVTDAAKALQVRPKDLFDYLRQNGWIYKRPGSTTYLGYQSKTIAGMVEHKVSTVLRGDGSEVVSEQVRITPKGLAKLATLLKPLEVVA